MISLLKDGQQISTNRLIQYFLKHRTILLLTLIYSGLIISLSYSHVVWRDEVRALSIAMDSRTPLDLLFQGVHNEGHPILWYLVLWVGFQLTHSVWILKVASVSIAIILVYFFLLKSPFSLLQKALFIFGFYPAFLYSVVCRGYGLSQLLLFWICYLYPKRFTQNIIFAGVLFLFANSEVHALIIVSAIFLALIVELVWKRRELLEDPVVRKRIAVGLAIIAFGIVFSVLQLSIDKTSDHPKVLMLNFGIVSKEFLNAALFAGDSFNRYLGIRWVPGCLIVWFFYLFLARNLLLLGVCFVSITGLAMIGHLVYPLGELHQGYLYFLMIAGFWIEIERENHNRAIFIDTSGWRVFLTKARQVFLYVLLIAQLVMAYQWISQAIKVPNSSSRSFGEFLDDHPEFKNAIIIGERAEFMESVAYYTRARIYMPREGRFSKTVGFTSANRRNYSLQELLETAKRLKNLYHCPILIALELVLDSKGPFTGARSFTCPKEQLIQFLNSTLKVASFRRKTISREEYDVYLLK